MLIKGKIQNPLLRYIYHRVHARHKDCSICISGELGSGKTLIALTLAQRLYRRFRLEKHFHQNIESYYKQLIVDAPSEVLIYDEGQEDLDAQEWQERLTRLFSKKQALRRIKRKVSIVTVPFKSWLTLRVRQLFNIQIEALGVDWGKSLVMFKAYKLKRLIKKNGEIDLGIKRFQTEYKEPINKFYMKFDKELYKKYEVFGKKFKEEGLAEPLLVLDKLREIKAQQDSAAKAEEYICDEIIKNYNDFATYKKGKLTIDKYKVLANWMNILTDKRAEKLAKIAEVKLKKIHPELA